MCTVTIFPTSKNNFVLTSSRDEAPNRKSLKPDVYTVDKTKMLYPKDETSGGSWIGVSDKNRLLCVLNGGFTFHERLNIYRISRGIVMRDLLSCLDIETAIKEYDLENVEPFTLVIADWNLDLRFFELVWDGNLKHFNELPLEIKMWSSSSLYSQSMKEERQLWFQNYKKSNELNSESILRFHKNTHIENTEYGIVMDRVFVKTTSITQVEKDNDKVTMQFNSLIKKESSKHQFKFTHKIDE